MRPLLAPLLTLFVMLAACGRTVKIQTVYEKDPDGNAYKASEYEYVPTRVNGNEIKQRHGLMRMYYPNGKIRKEQHYEWDVLHGESKSYNEEGILFHVENWSNGKPDGKSVLYGAEGKIKMEESYKKGLRDGEERQYYSNGKVRSILIYKDDKLWQSVASYDSTGKKLDELSIVGGNGVLNGWNLNNTLSASTEMRNGLAHGKARRYFANGKLEKEYENREGRRQGLFKAFHPNGVLARESTYENNYLTGVNRLYDSSGVLREELSYKDHLTPLDIIHLRDSLMNAIGKGLDAYFNIGMLSGAHKIYFENGKLQSEEYYFDNLRDSIARAYYDNGKLKSEVFYDGDFDQGRRYEKTFDRNGKLVKSKTYAKRKLEAPEPEPELDTVSSFLKDALAPDKQ